jgi:small subunit ribosomal protein S6
VAKEGFELATCDSRLVIFGEKKMQRIYEVMFIVRPDLTDEDVDKLVSTFETNIANAGATLKKTDRLGKRRLAYLVRKFHEGNYVLFTVEAAGNAIHEIERRLRVSEPVIKFITVRTDLEQKRIDKIKAIRATKVRRSATAPAEAPAPAAEESPAEASA